MSESIFDKPLNGDLEALSSSVVKSINGKKPDPITGDITVIEGGGSGSYGAYRLDTTIPVSSWSGSGPYTVTIVNELIKSTMDGKSWLDNDTALLGETTFTSQDGSLLISTPVKPTEDWVLHVSFALNGADVLADSEEQKKAIGKILPVINGTTNNSGYTINSGDYFEANGNIYKASATIPINESWSSSSDALPTSALSDIHTKMGDVGSTSLQSQVNTLNSKTTPYMLGNNQQLKQYVLDTTLFPENSIRWVNLRNGSTTGLPSSSAVYAFARINKRTASVINIEIYQDDGTHSTCSTTDGGATWSAWKEFALNSNIERYNNPDWYNSIDLDTLTTSGFYMVGQNNSHAPGTWGFLIVIAPRSDVIWHIFQSQYLLSIREYRNNVWTSWRNVSIQS